MSMPIILHATDIGIRDSVNAGSRGFRLEKEGLISYLACYIGMHFLYNSKITNSREKGLISGFLGEKIKTILLQKIQQYPPPHCKTEVSCLSRVGWIQDFDGIWQQYEITGEKCRFLGNFILEHPCIKPITSQVAIRPFSVDIESLRNLCISNEQIKNIRKRTSEKRVTILLISQSSIKTLVSIMKKYESVAVVRSFVSSNESTELIPRRKKTQKCPCVLM